MHFLLTMVIFQILCYLLWMHIFFLRTQNSYRYFDTRKKIKNEQKHLKFISYKWAPADKKN